MADDFCLEVDDAGGSSSPLWVGVLVDRRVVLAGIDNEDTLSGWKLQGESDVGCGRGVSSVSACSDRQSPGGGNRAGIETGRG